MNEQIMAGRRLREITSDRFTIDFNMPKSYLPIKARPTEEGGVRDRFFAAKAELPDEITVIRPFNTDAFESKNHTFYIAESGCDKGDGTKDSPLATLNEAVRRAEKTDGALIKFRGGKYNMSETVRITSSHSGSETSPLIITAEDGEVPYISASHTIPAASFVPLTDENMLRRLKYEVRDKVIVADLKALGISDYDKIGFDGATLEVNGEPQIIARYPNDPSDMIPLGDTVYKPNKLSEDDEWSWEIPIADEHCLDWEEKDPWLFGALFREYFHKYAQIKCIDPEKMSIKGADNFPTDDFEDGKVEPFPGNRYCFVHIFEELDMPGEYYLDRTDGKLYYYPKNGALTEIDDIRLITKSLHMIEVENAENVIIDRLNMGRNRDSVITVRDSRQVLIQRCRIFGNCSPDAEHFSAIDIDGGSKCGAIATVFEYFTGRGIRINGGDRANLIPANNFFQNCMFINPLCRFGSGSGGCGNIISHNYYHNTTHGDGGQNEGIIEYNVFEGGDTEGHDSGVIYVAGGGLSSCGNHYRYNYLYDFAEADYGIYFDDLSRGMYAYGNIVVGNGTIGDGTEWKSGGRSYNHHNGGEHCYYNNISIDAGYFAFGGDITYWLFDDNWNALYRSAVEASRDKRTAHYLGRNPTYRDYLKDLDKYTEDRKDPNYEVKSGAAERRLRTPWCNNYENNVIVRAARPYKLDNGEETATSLDTNFITNDDPGFVDFEGRDYRIKADAPIYEKIPDFVPPPFEKMGLTDDFAE